MGYGIVNRRKIQFGQEAATAPGTPVAATVMWRGPAEQMDGGETVVYPDENVGYLVDLDRSYISSKLASVPFPDTEATYEQILYPLNGAIKAVTSGVRDGTTGSGYLYDFEVSETGANTIQPFTIEAGDNTDCSDMEYSFCQSFTLTWAEQTGLKISQTWQGRQRTKGQTFATLTPPAVEEILAPTIFIDDGGGTIGSTQLTGTVIGYSLVYDSGIKGQHAANGELYFEFIKYRKPTCTLTITFEHNASAVTERAAYDDRTTRLIRIKHEGSAISQGDGAYAAKTLLVDICGTYSEFPPYDDTDQDNTITASLRAGYNATDDLYLRILDVVDQATLT